MGKMEGVERKRKGTKGVYCCLQHSGERGGRYSYEMLSSPSSLSPLAYSLTRSVFYSELKTWLFGKSFPP